MPPAKARASSRCGPSPWLLLLRSFAGFDASHKVVPGKVKRKRCAASRFFAVRQTRETADLHSEGQILHLDMRSADPLRIGVANARDWDALHNLSWAVPLFALARSRIHLDEFENFRQPKFQATARVVMADTGAPGGNT